MTMEISDGTFIVLSSEETCPVLHCILATAMLALGSIHIERKAKRIFSLMFVIVLLIHI